MRKSIQVAINENLDLMLGFIAAAGFKEISLSFASCDFSNEKLFEKTISDTKKLLKKHKLLCSQTHLPCYHLLVSSEQTDNNVENNIKKSIEASAAIGAKWAVYHPRTAVNNGFDRNLSYQHNKKFLSEYLSVAEKFDVGIAVENMPLYPYSDPQWRFFGGGFEELCTLIDEFNSDKLGICWDFGHAHTASIDQEKVLKYIGNKLKATHVHDNYKNGDHHQLPLLADLQWGSINWGKIMPVVEEIKYDSPFVLEVILPPLDATANFIKLGYDCLTQLENLL